VSLTWGVDASPGYSQSGAPVWCSRKQLRFVDTVTMLVCHDLVGRGVDDDFERIDQLCDALLPGILPDFPL